MNIVIAVLIMLCGLFINGPYALITTAVSSDLVREFTIYIIFVSTHSSVVLINLVLKQH